MKTFIKGFIGAVLGTVLILLSYTLYTDHKIIQTLAAIEMQRQQAAQSQPK